MLYHISSPSLFIVLYYNIEPVVQHYVICKCSYEHFLKLGCGLGVWEWVWDAANKIIQGPIWPTCNIYLGAWQLTIEYGL